MNKLGELILKKHMEGSQWYAPVCDSRVLAAMQEYAEAYHEAKLKQITDDDIEAYADRLADAGSLKDFERGEWLGVKEGARAMRNSEIKHIEK